MGTTSLTATCGTIVVALLVVWGLNWYCVNEKPTGWIGNDLCPAVSPLYKLSGTALDWFVGLFGDDGTQKPVPKPATGYGQVVETYVSGWSSRDGYRMPEPTQCS